MTLYELLYKVIEQVEREKGNLVREQVVEEKVEYILKHSSMKYNANVFRLESFTSFGVECWKDVELQLPKYMIFRISYDMKDWVLKTFNDLKHLEFDLRNSEDTVQIALFDGDVKEYNIVKDTFNNRVIWNHPIYQIEYKEDKEDKSILIYDNRQLEEEIKRLVKGEQVEDLQIFNISLGMFEHFYVKDVIFSTSKNNLPFEFYWGKSEMSFLDIAEDDEDDIW